MDSDSVESLLVSTGEVRLEDGLLLQLVRRRMCDISGVHTVDAKLVKKTSAKKGKVDWLQAYLLQRPDRSFFEYADEVSQELQGLTCTFCESNGVASRIQHPTLLESPRAINSGGFLQIYIVEVRPDHQKRDLGLRMIHETLLFLHKSWTLAVMVPGLLGSHKSKWIPPEDSDDPRQEPTPEEIAAYRASELKLAKHFLRMGFCQAGRNRALCGKYFLTVDKYLPEGENPNDAMSRWIPKEATKDIDIFVPAEIVKPSGLDEELAKLLRRSCSGNNYHDLIDSILNLVQGGASIHGARSMHIAAANKTLGVLVLQELIRLGGICMIRTRTTEFRCTLRLRRLTVIIAFLVQQGADRSKRDSFGRTPLQCVEDQLQAFKDLLVTFSIRIPPRDVDMIPAHEAFCVLMDAHLREQLIDDWLSPRMREALLITAELQADEIEYGFTFEAYWRAMLPSEVWSRRPDGLSPLFVSGFGQVFKVIAQLLRGGHAPTMDRIRGSVRRGGAEHVEHMLREGGKYEYVIDAVFYMTEMAITKSDCGWEYGTFAGQIEGHPATPLDRTFDIGLFKCLNEGGGSLDTRGPYVAL